MIKDIIKNLYPFDYSICGKGNDEAIKVFKSIKNNGKIIRYIWLNISKKYNVPIKLMGTDAIPSFEFCKNQNINKTFLTQQMLHNKILAIDLIYVNIYHNKNNLKKYKTVLDKIFLDILKKEIKKILKSKICFKPINRIN